MRVRVRVRRCLEEERVSSLQLVHVGDEDGSAPAAAAAAALLAATPTTTTATTTTAIAAAVNSRRKGRNRAELTDALLLLCRPP